MYHSLEACVFPGPHKRGLRNPVRAPYPAVQLLWTEAGPRAGVAELADAQD